MHHTERQIRRDEPVARQIEKHDALLRTIADDARSLAGSYAKETLVPEGGE